MRRLKLLLRYAPVLPLLLLVVFFLMAPLGSMLIKSVTVPGGASYTLRHYGDVFSKAIYHAALRNSLYLSFVSSLWGIVIAFFAAMSLSKIAANTRSRFMSILSMTSNFSGLPLGFAFMVMLGTTGVLMQASARLNMPLSDVYNLYSGKGLLLLYIYFQIPLGTLLLYPAFHGIRKEWIEAAALMQAYGFQFWTRIGIPLLLPSLADTFAMLFANALTSYATPFVIMSTNYPLLPIKIASMYTGEAVQQQEVGAALSVVMILVMLAVIGICNFVKKYFYKGDAL